MVKEFDHLFKIVMIGDSAVGKSSLLMKFAHNVFDPEKTATIGVDFKTKTIEKEGKKIKLQIWDTAGQERYRTITNTYYRGSNGVIVVFDVTKRKTFDSVDTWLKNIKKSADSKIEVLIVGNKIDLEGQREVTFEEAEKFSEKVNFKYFEASAFTGKNVEELNDYLINKIYKRVKSQMSKKELKKNVQISDENVFNDKEKDKKKCCT